LGDCRRCLTFAVGCKRISARCASRAVLTPLRFQDRIAIERCTTKMKSAATTKGRPDPPLPTTPAADTGPSASFIAARDRWSALRLQMRKLNVRREQLQVGLNYAGLAIGNEPELVRRLVSEFDQDLLATMRRNPRKIHLELENLIDEIIALQPGYCAEHELFEAAKSSEATRIAQLFRDRHREAVLGIAAALEEMNLAIEAEREIRRAYAKVSPEPTSAALPDLSSDFAEMDLAQWHGVAATWARRIQAGGFAS